MKASELIVKLGELIKEQGDREVMRTDGESGMMFPVEEAELEWHLVPGKQGWVEGLIVLD